MASTGRRPFRVLLGLVSCAVLLALPRAASAQSVVAGDLVGTVRTYDGEIVPRALLTLRELRSGIEFAVTADGSGRFERRFLPQGEYRVSVEALGYRPLIVTGVSVAPGDVTRVPVRLAASAPPVTQVDTVRYDRLFALSGLARQVDADAVRGLPDRRRDLEGLIRLASFADPDGGVEGLPADMTSIVADGRPLARVGGSVPTFPRLGLSGVTIGRGLDDIEWSEAAGGLIVLEARPAGATSGGEGFAAASSSALWGSDRVDDVPGFVSVWAGAAGGVPVRPDTAALSFAIEGRRYATPLSPTAADTLLPALLGDATPAFDPAGLAETTQLAGSARLDWAIGERGYLLARANLGRFTREAGAASFRAGRYGDASVLPEEGSDLDLAAAVLTPISDRVVLEVRAGVAQATREVAPDRELLPATRLVEERAYLGFPLAEVGRRESLDLGATAAVHFDVDRFRVKGGLTGGYHDDTAERPSELRRWAFADLAAAQAGDGWIRTTTGRLTQAEFSTFDYGVFGQATYADTAGFALTLGARYGVTQLPADEVDNDEEWLELTGIETALRFPDQVTAIDTKAKLSWFPGGTGATRFELAGGVQHGMVDASLLRDVIDAGRGGTVYAGVGDFDAWPDAPATSTLTEIGRDLAFLGSELEAPRTTRAVGTVSRRFVPGLTMGLTASWRRTEFLLRRADLNLARLPAGEDQYGRTIQSPVAIQEGLLVPGPGASRRFLGFADVWRLTPDGWSEYGGVTAFAQGTVGAAGQFWAEYTYSTTEDNWVRAREQGVGDDVEASEVSDFDVPHRFVATAEFPLRLGAGASLAGVLRVRSALPFTATVADGIDADGDGDPTNDFAFVIDEPAVRELTGEWECLQDDLGQLATRNACRGDPVRQLDLRLSVGLGSVGGWPASLMVDALDVLGGEEGVRDTALLLVDPDAQVERTGDLFTVPWVVNPGFGRIIERTDPGRLFRIGVRLGGGG